MSESHLERWLLEFVLREFQDRPPFLVFPDHLDVTTWLKMLAAQWGTTEDVLTNILERWDDEGAWDCGVTVRSGWAIAANLRDIAIELQKGAR